MQGVVYRDAQRATLVGYNGRVVQSSDGGDTWIEQHRDTTLTLHGVAFASRDTGVAVGSRHTKSYMTPEPGRILRTIDGGKSWALVATPDVRSLSAVAFADGRQGVAVGNNGAVLRTTDAGATWQLLKPAGTEDFTAVTFAGPSGWAVGHQIRLQTTDGGAHWKKETPNDIYYGVAFPDAQHGVVVGHGLASVTLDGGRHWGGGVAALMDYTAEARNRGLVTRETEGMATSFMSVAMPKLGTIVATSRTGLFARTTDWGNHWQIGETGSRQQFIAVTFADSLNGIALGAQVLRTRDGGVTWSDVTNSGASQRVAVGGLSGTWNVTISELATPGMLCDYNTAMTLFLVHGDSALSGTVDGWHLSCRGSSRSETQTAVMTTDRSMEATFPALDVSGWTDRLRGVRLEFAGRGGRARLEGSLASSMMSGPIRFNMYTDKLGEVELEGHWRARRVEGAPAPEHAAAPNEPVSVATTEPVSADPAQPVLERSHTDLMGIAVKAPVAGGSAESRFAGFREQSGAFGRVTPAPGGGVKFALADWSAWKDTVFLPAVSAPLPAAARITMVWEDSEDQSGLFGFLIGDEPAKWVSAELVSITHYLYLNGQYSEEFSHNRSGVDTVVVEFNHELVSGFVNRMPLVRCLASSPVGGSVRIYAQSGATAVIRSLWVQALKPMPVERGTLKPGDCEQLRRPR